MLSIRHFTIFHTVAETESFTKAAQTLYITQSAVSHAIKELEGYTGMVLFDRLSKHVQLTANGKILLQEVSPILAACNALEKRIGRLGEQAPIQIVSSITIAAFWLPQILRQVKQRLANVPIHVTVVSASEAIKILQAGGADIAFIEGTQPQGPFLCKTFDSYTLNIICSPEYPLRSKNLSVSEFCSQNLLLREQGSAIRDVLDSRLFLLGYTARPMWVSVNSTALIQAAKAGLGITVLPEVLVKDELFNQTLRTIKVDQLQMQNNLIAVWHKDKYMTPALKTLLAYFL